MALRLLTVLVAVLACARSAGIHPANSSPAQATAAWSLDSARAVALACGLVRQLRPATRKTVCQVEAVREEPDAFTVKVQERAADGAPLDFPRSILRLPKDSAKVAVSRIPDL